jgi:predicted DNA-binding transcriptional regulator AlpA
MSAVKIPVQQKLFSPQETAVITGRSLSSVWRDIAKGRLRKVKIGGSTRVTGESIDALIAEGSQPLERAYLAKARTASADKAHAKAAANRERQAKAEPVA